MASTEGICTVDDASMPPPPRSATAAASSTSSWLFILFFFCRMRRTVINIAAIATIAATPTVIPTAAPTTESPSLSLMFAFFGAIMVSFFDGVIGPLGAFTVFILLSPSGAMVGLPGLVDAVVDCTAVGDRVGKSTGVSEVVELKEKNGAFVIEGTNGTDVGEAKGSRVIVMMELEGALVSSVVLFD